MAFERRICEYLKEFYQTHSQFRVARHSVVSNLLFVVGLLATMTLAMLKEVPDLLRHSLAWQIVLAGLGVAALTCAFLVIYKLVKHVIARLDYHVPNFNKKAFEDILKLDEKNADEPTLLRDFAQNYMAAIDENVKRGEEGRKAIVESPKLVFGTIALIWVFAVLWLVAVLTAPSGVDAPQEARETQPTRKEGVKMLTPEDDPGADSGSAPGGASEEPASSEPASEPSEEPTEPTPTKQPLAVAKPLLIEGKEEPRDNTMQRGEEE